MSSDGNKEFSYVVVARHGERHDYLTRDRGGNWVKSATRPWDPPLSNHGVEQARKLGQHLAQKLRKDNLPPIAAVYSSPFLRCRQTAAAATLQAYKEVQATTEKRAALPKVRIEPGLAESINEKWYRSWALHYSDGTWGKKLKGETEVDVSKLHKAASQPVQELLQWEETIDTNNSANMILFDFEYEPTTSIGKEFTFDPPNLETDEEQRERMGEVVKHVCTPGKTILLVSHGAPVTHLFEELTGKERKEHGVSSYCCYSLYRRPKDCDKWEAVEVNQAGYLNEKVTKEDHFSS